MTGGALAHTPRAARIRALVGLVWVSAICVLLLTRMVLPPWWHRGGLPLFLAAGVGAVGLLLWSRTLRRRRGAQVSAGIRPAPRSWLIGGSALVL